MTTLDDLVFEKRNKAYGAFELRKAYKGVLTRSAILGSSIFLTLVGSAYTYEKYGKEHFTVTEYNPTIIDIPPPPKQTIIKPEEVLPPPPEKEELVLKQEKFLPPEPKIDDQMTIETPPPTQDKLENAIISNKTVEGVDALTAFIPKPPDKVEDIIVIDKTDDQKTFVTVEQVPEFPGGMKALYEFLGKNIRYPNAAKNTGVEGKVFMKFVVDKDGSIINVEVEKGIGFGCDEEALRVINMLPKWNPGRQNGRNVKVYYHLPISFRLQ